MIMKTLGSRLKDVFRLNNIKIDDICNITNKKQPTISTYLSDRTFPNQEFFDALTQLAPDINLHWLLTGKGEMNLNNNSGSLEKELTAVKQEREELIATLGVMRRMIPTSSAKFKSVCKTGNSMQRIGKKLFMSSVSQFTE
jgi:transcriptional regulator with XRE-family HTH domain